jgi:hypothetical protein
VPATGPLTRSLENVKKGSKEHVQRAKDARNVKTDKHDNRLSEQHVDGPQQVDGEKFVQCF